MKRSKIKDKSLVNLEIAEVAKMKVLSQSATFMPQSKREPKLPFLVQSGLKIAKHEPHAHFSRFH